MLNIFSLEIEKSGREDPNENSIISNHYKKIMSFSKMGNCEAAVIWLAHRTLLMLYIESVKFCVCFYLYHTHVVTLYHRYILRECTTLYRRVFVSLKYSVSVSVLQEAYGLSALVSVI